MSNNIYLDFDAFLRSFNQNKDSSFAFLLGQEVLSAQEYSPQMIAFGSGRRIFSCLTTLIKQNIFRITDLTL